MIPAPAAALLALLAAALFAKGDGPALEVPSTAGERVRLVGLEDADRQRLGSLAPSALEDVLSVFTGDGVSSKPAILGSYAIDAAGLHFTPRFPFVSGMRYTALAIVRGKRLERTFEVEAPAGSPPRVVAVFPSGAELPENTLRLYVHFSQPMNPRAVHRHVRLVGDDGITVPLSFVEIEHGLWDARQMRLTLFFHPGRVKRGVAPGEDLGPVLVTGRAYRLVVDGSLADATGRTMGREFEHGFTAVNADRMRPDADGIAVIPPATPNGMLVATLPEPLDEALLHRLIWVEDETGGSVPGEIAVLDGETRWAFRPRDDWNPGRYALRVHTALEDRAGNRFDRLFDRASGTGHSDADARGGPLSLAFSFSGAPAR